MDQPNSPTPPPKRGLGALLQSTANRPAAGSTGAGNSGPGGGPASLAPAYVSIRQIRANPKQPRKEFDELALAELADSIKAKGVIQPVVVRPLRAEEMQGEVKYELIAGERRWRASQKAELYEIPAIVKDVQVESEILLLSLIENIQRDNLNPIEEAEAYTRLREAFSLTQEEIAGAVGKSRASIANAFRLLELPDSVQDLIKNGRLSVGHAKVLLALPDPKYQVHFASKAVSQDLTVRELEKLMGAEEEETPRVEAEIHKRPMPATPAHIKGIETRLSKHFGTKVRVVQNKKRGKIMIDFYSVEDFDRISKIFGIQKY